MSVVIAPLFAFLWGRSWCCFVLQELVSSFFVDVGVVCLSLEGCPEGSKKRRVLFRLASQRKKGEKKKKGRYKQTTQTASHSGTDQRSIPLNQSGSFCHVCCEVLPSFFNREHTRTQEDTQEHAAADSTTATHRRD